MKLVLLALLVASVFAQNVDSACSTEAQKTTHYSVTLDAEKCLIKEALENVPALEDLVSADATFVQVTKVPNTETVKVELVLTENNNCGTNSDQACLNDNYYTVYIENTNGDDITPPGTTLANTNIVFDIATLHNPQFCTVSSGDGTGVTGKAGSFECPLTVSYSFTGITRGVILTKTITVVINKDLSTTITGNLAASVGAGVSVPATDPLSLSFDPSCTLTNTNASFDGASTGIELGGSAYFKLVNNDAPSATFVSLTSVELETKNGNTISVNCTSEQDDSVPAAKFYKITCPVDYFGSYKVNVVGVSGSRRRLSASTTIDVSA